MKYLWKYLAPIIVILILNTAAGQDTIRWRSDYKLEWRDFQAKPDTAMGLEALTFSGIDCKYTFTDTLFVFDVSCFFERNRSWRMSWADSVALRHEQVHFDISEIFARKLKEELANLRPSRYNVKSGVDSLFKKITRQKEDMQDKYDQETDFGRIPEGQKKWQDQIARLLRSGNSMK